MAGFHTVEELTNLAPHAFLLAADVTTVRNVPGNQAQRRCIFPDDPFHTQATDFLFQGGDGQLELSLFQRDRNEFVWKWRALLVGDESMQQREAIFATGNADGNA